MTKKNYIQPELEVIAINAMTALCESVFGDFHFGGGAGDTLPPDEHGI